MATTRAIRIMRIMATHPISCIPTKNTSPIPHTILHRPPYLFMRHPCHLQARHRREEYPHMRMPGMDLHPGLNECEDTIPACYRPEQAPLRPSTV